MLKILVIDDRVDIRLSISMLLSDHGYQVMEADSIASAQLLLAQNDYALLLLDMNYTLDTTSGDEGLSFLRWMKSLGMQIPVIAMTAWSNVDLAVKAMQLGAADFIEKPWKNKRLLQIIKHQITIERLRSQNYQFKQRLSENRQKFYTWRSECMRTLLKDLELVAPTDVSILLTGNNGTGKSLLANYIHQKSSRHQDPMIAVNMGSLSQSLFESEMFGHKKGAFTDAKQHRIGRFQLAEGGTLFLDEITNIPVELQAGLLCVLESGEYEILGSSKTLTTDVRIISASNADMHKLIQQGEFREDLYYRLNAIEFHVPSLRKRTEDILPLAHFFLDKFANTYNRSHLTLSEAAQDALTQYHWPGNIRELHHLIERAVLLAKGRVIDRNGLYLLNKPDPKEFSLMTLEEAEVRLINLALKKSNNHVANAAQILGLSKSSLYRRIEKHRLLISHRMGS